MKRRRRYRYGIDAPYVPVLLAVIGLGVFGAAIVAFATGGPFPAWTVVWLIWDLLFGLVMLASAAVYLHTTLRGKFLVWSELLDALGLRGNESVLDMGCGRGAVLMLAARRLDSGRAVGVDLWRGVDQSGNSEDAAQANVEAAGVADRVELRTGDMTAMPFADAEFDLVVASMAIHNIASVAHRRAAVDEAFRVLRPGGRLMLVDFRRTRDYQRLLTERGMSGLRRQRLGWRFWYGGPWAAAALVTGTKPVTSRGSARLPAAHTDPDQALVAGPTCDAPLAHLSEPARRR